MIRLPRASAAVLSTVRPPPSPFPLHTARVWRSLATTVTNPPSPNDKPSSSSSSTPSPNPTFASATAAANTPTTSASSQSSFSSPSFTAPSQASAALTMGHNFLDRLQGAGQIELFHMSHVALLVGIPAAVLLSPSILVVPFDIALGLLIPWHSHVGIVNVLEDYVPRPYRKMAIMAMWGVSIVTALGILKINLCGAGLTESVKALWRQPPTLHSSYAPTSYTPSTTVTSSNTPAHITTTTVKQA